MEEVNADLVVLDLDDGESIDVVVDENGEIVQVSGYPGDDAEPSDVLAYLDRRIPEIDAKIVGLKASRDHQLRRIDAQYGVKIRYMEKLRESLVQRSYPRIADTIKSLLYKNKKSVKLGNITFGWRSQPRKIAVDTGALMEWIVTTEEGGASPFASCMYTDVNESQVKALVKAGEAVDGVLGIKIEEQEDKFYVS